MSSITEINSVQTRCIVKGEAQKSPLFWRFSGSVWFSQDRLLSRNSTRKPFQFNKIPDFTNTPCKSTCLCDAPGMHTVEESHVLWPDSAMEDAPSSLLLDNHLHPPTGTRATPRATWPHMHDLSSPGCPPWLSQRIVLWTATATLTAIAYPDDSFLISCGTYDASRMVVAIPSLRAQR